DGDSQLTDLDVLTQGQFGGGKIGRVHRDHSYVGGDVSTEYLSLVGGSVGKADIHRLLPRHHMGRREHQTVRVVDDTAPHPATCLDLDHRGEDRLRHGGHGLFGRVGRWRRRFLLFGRSRLFRSGGRNGRGVISVENQSGAT